MKTDKKVFITCPAARGEVETDFTLSLLYTVVELGRHGWATQLNFIKGCAEISIARSIMLADFMASGCEWNLSIDADLGWDPRAVSAMVTSGHDFQVGIYPAKVDDGPTFQHQGLETTPTGALRCTMAPGGFMLFRRRVVERMIAANPELCCSRSGNEFHYLFMPMIVQREDGSNNALGEDYAFCERWRRTGGKILVYPDIDFNHHGKRCWQGNMLRDTRWADDGNHNEGHREGGAEDPAGAEPEDGSGRDLQQRRLVGSKSNDARVEGSRR